MAKIHQGKQERISLGNMDARRDWGYAREYVEMMWMMLQQDTPEDFVAATITPITIELVIIPFGLFCKKF